MIPVDFFDAAQSLPTTSTREDPLPQTWLHLRILSWRKHRSTPWETAAPFQCKYVLPCTIFDVKNPFRARYELIGWSWKTGHLSTKLAIFILLMDLGILFSALCMTTNSVWKSDLRDCRENVCENVSTQPTGSSEEQHQNAIWKQKRPRPLPFKPPHRPIKMSTTIRSTRIQRFPNVCSMVFQNK